MKPFPKDTRANLHLRQELLSRASRDQQLRRELWIRCSRDILFYANAMCWTYNPKSYPDSPIRPFILWPYQEEALLTICEAIGKHDVPVKKSRDAGASWLCLLAFEWRWHFRKGQSFLLVSRVEDLVDKKNEPDSLFWKIDFLHEHQPKWLLPQRDRQSKSLYNLDNGSSITGSSTTGEAGRGGRKVAILLDEFAAVPDGYAMLSATRDATNTRLMNSTPKGSSGAYADQLTKIEKTNPEYVVTMHWSQHPLKQAGLYRVTKGVIELLDKDYFGTHPGYPFVTSGPFFWDGELRSVWYDEQCNRAASPQEIAQELDMKMAESAYQYFDSSVLVKLRDKYAQQPYRRGEIVWDGDDWKTGRWDETETGRLLLWCHPDAAGKIPWNDITIGCDVATGKGGDMSSNSVASIVRGSTGEKIGEFAVNTQTAFEFCEYVLAMCTWCNNAFLIYEDIGPGGEFTRRLRGGTVYSNVYRRDADEKTISRNKTKKLGFAPSLGSKRALLADYRNALMTGKFINHSDEALAECGHYEVRPDDNIQHSKALASIDPNARGKNHGDRVIADALAWRGIQDLGRTFASQAPPLIVPVNCAAARRRQREEAELADLW
jgi:hypothetical protein